MNLQTKMPTTADEFLRWNEGREGKREFVKGRVVELMINVTRNHARIAAKLVMVLGRQLDLSQYDIGTADFGVRTSAGVRYPDVFVDRKTTASHGADLVATAPLFLAEILSPSSLARDFVEKLDEYRGIESLHYYLILSHEEPRVWLSSRGEEGWGKPVEIAGQDAVVELGRLNVQLTLAELYTGIER